MQKSLEINAHMPNCKNEDPRKRHNFLKSLDQSGALHSECLKHSIKYPKCDFSFSVNLFKMREVLDFWVVIRMWKMKHQHYFLYFSLIFYNTCALFSEPV